jgi:hypothetical protein
LVCAVQHCNAIIQLPLCSTSNVVQSITSSKVVGLCWSRRSSARRSKTTSLHFYTPAAQDPQDPYHKDAKHLIRLRCLSRHNVTYQQSYRHHNVVNFLVLALRQAFLSPKKEQATTIGEKRWDLVFFNPDFIKALHKLIFGDVTVISPIQVEYLNETILKDVNISMSDAYKHKVAHYLEDITVQPPGSIFLPLVLDSLGGIHSGLLQLLFNASPHAQQQPPARSKNHTCWHYPDYWIQAVSVANFTGTARSVIKTVELSQNNACLS